MAKITAMERVEKARTVTIPNIKGNTDLVA